MIGTLTHAEPLAPPERRGRFVTMPRISRSGLVRRRSAGRRPIEGCCVTGPGAITVQVIEAGRDATGQSRSPGANLAVSPEDHGFSALSADRPAVLPGGVPTRAAQNTSVTAADLPRLNPGFPSSVLNSAMSGSETRHGAVRIAGFPDEPGTAMCDVTVRPAGTGRMLTHADVDNGWLGDGGMSKERRWLVVAHDGHHSTIGIRTDPSPEEILSVGESLDSAGMAAWLVVSEGNYDEGGVVTLLMVRPITNRKGDWRDAERRWHELRARKLNKFG